MLKHYKNNLIAITSSIMIMATTAWGAEQINIENPWIRSAPPTATVLAGYMTIHNRSGNNIVFTAASSPSFSTVQLHRTTLHNGMMHMETVKTLPINAGGSATLEPGSYHLMLSNPKQAIKTGDSIPLTLHFENITKSIHLIVKQNDEATTDANSHQHH